MKLNQVLAIEGGDKSKAEATLTSAYQRLQKTEPIQGIVKTYQPKNEEGEQLPPERKLVQVKVHQTVREVAEVFGKFLDTTLTKDVGNCSAKANLIVDGTVLVKDVPVTTLLFLEKKLVDWVTFFRKLPTLDPADEWSFDRNQDCYATKPEKRHRTIKENYPLELAPATEKHPAQVQLATRDVIDGYWTTIKYSGAMPAQQVNQLVARAEKLLAAVKVAREEANGQEVKTVPLGEQIFGYLLEPLKEN